MAKTDKVVKDLDQALKAYGGKRKFAEAFRYDDAKTMCEAWKHRERFGPPPGARLGLYMGLLARAVLRRYGSAQSSHSSNHCAIRTRVW
jgi:hypothetical protein